MDKGTRKRIGIVGVSGYGGGEALRLCAAHPGVEVAYAAADSSAGQRLGERYPGLPRDLAERSIERWDAEQARALGLDLVILSLPTGASQEAVAALGERIKVIDVGGDHRWVAGWVYGLTEVTGRRAIAQAWRVADPGCFPAATLLALAPLVCGGLVDPEGIIVDAKTGVSGAGRGGGSSFGYADVNEDVAAYNLYHHAHQPEMREALTRLAGRPASLVFSPHLVPMTRGIYATCYARGQVTQEEALAAARSYYQDAAFVRVVDAPPHSKWAQGSNLAFVSYASDSTSGIVTAMGVVDNLGKGAAGQAVQNMNLMLGLPEEAGLGLVPGLP